VQALSGLLRAQGGVGAPIVSTMPVHDIGGGTVAAFGALAALYAREHTGQGQVVQTSLASASVSPANSSPTGGTHRRQSVDAIFPAKGVPDAPGAYAGRNP
jgi:crotonobetainyl-CoA:carnitine CoA-transferase CaiB-like acyl-CoA transferase